MRPDRRFRLPHSQPFTSIPDMPLREIATIRLVLDSSVLIAAMKPGDPGHVDAIDLLNRLRKAQERVALLAPPELWLEVRVASQKLAKTTSASPQHESDDVFANLVIELVPITSVAEIDEFFDCLKRHVRDKAPFANATDLAYLWVAWQRDATLVTFDAGLLKYHRMLCDVVRPFHVRLD